MQTNRLGVVDKAWAIYGYTVCYRETHDKKVSESGIEDFPIYENTSPRLPKDLIPYWDMDAPNIPNEPRDASSASCIASALYEISTMDVPDANSYKNYADSIMASLASPKLSGISWKKW